MMTFLDNEPLPINEPKRLSGSMVIEYRVADLKLRDYFAAQAISQLIKEGYTGRSVAEMAYEIADTMLRIRDIERPEEEIKES